MKNSCKIILIFFLICIGLFLAQINTPNAHALGLLYVKPDGSDGDNCQSPETACLTINGAIGKATSGDTIQVAVGIYTGSDISVVTVSKDVTLSGGWDNNFTAQTWRSTIDGQHLRRGVYIHAGVVANIDRFTIQNGSIESGGAGIWNDGDLTLNYSIVQNNQGGEYCWGGGISNGGTMLIQWTTIQENSCTYAGYGGGIYNYQYGGSLTINNSLLQGNHAASGGGIRAVGQNISINNTTITGNTVAFGLSDSLGGGIYYRGDNDYVLSINNSTITGNEGAQAGGGIYFPDAYGGELIIQNTIVADNTANENPDCEGSLTSAGYNIIGNTIGCSLLSTTGDQLNVDPLIGILQDNGGPTLTQWLYEGSPAIDAGNPAGCTDHLGNLLNTDQRGFIRPLDGDSDGNVWCDIGAYEADPATLPPPPPELLWYVSPAGMDTNDCKTPATTCASINGVLEKAQAEDTIYVATGIYTSTAISEVVLIDKDINLLGGWNANFESQDGFSTIDGEQARRGIFVKDELDITLSKFKVQNGFTSGLGGGIHLAYRTNAVIEDLILQDNLAGGGGGLGTAGYGIVSVTNCLVINNQADGYGGGVAGGGSVIMRNCTIAKNNASYGGGGLSSVSQLELIDSFVLSNTSGWIDGGGGIYASNAEMLILRNSYVIGNISEEEGGGILTSYLFMENSIVSNNISDTGGGISNGYDAEIINSSISSNIAHGGAGGGIYSVGALKIANTTIAYNQAQSSSGDGGGIFRAAGELELSNVTVAKNIAEGTGGGIWNQGLVNPRNSLFAENEAVTSPDCMGSFVSAGYNLIGNPSGCSFSSSTGDLINVDPKLVRLYFSSFALSPDSPAIDAGNPAGCKDHLNNPLTTDQIGTTRPLDGDLDESEVCDIGAFEYDPAHPPIWFFSFLPWVTTQP